VLVPAEGAGQRLAALLEQQRQLRGRSLVLQRVDHRRQVGGIVTGDDHEDVGLVLRPPDHPVVAMPGGRGVGGISEVLRAFGHALTEAELTERSGLLLSRELRNGCVRERDVDPRRLEARLLQAEPQTHPSMRPHEREHVVHR
jgi:hypothetical protein